MIPNGLDLPRFPSLAHEVTNNISIHSHRNIISITSSHSRHHIHVITFTSSHSRHNNILKLKMASQFRMSTPDSHMSIKLLSYADKPASRKLTLLYTKHHHLQTKHATHFCWWSVQHTLNKWCRNVIAQHTSPAKGTLLLNFIAVHTYPVWNVIAQHTVIHIQDFIQVTFQIKGGKSDSDVVDLVSH